MVLYPCDMAHNIAGFTIGSCFKKLFLVEKPFALQQGPAAQMAVGYKGSCPSLDKE